MGHIKFSDLKTIAKRCGLDAISYTNQLEALSQKENLENWQKQGYAADLEYMKRSSELLCHAKSIFEDLKSIVVFTINYSTAPRPDLKPGHGKVARYAWGKDYHRVIKKRLNILIQEIQAELDRPLNYRLFTDAVPLLERFYAKTSGLGFIGKNTMLIRPKLGSFFFISEVLWDLEIVEEALPIIKNNCGSCQNCIDLCPTSAFESPYQLNANKCISYLTIEKRGTFNQWEQNAIGDWLFGCDICQEVCPFNYRTLKYNQMECWEDFSDVVVKDGQISLKEILEIRNDQQFKDLFQGSPLMRTKREGLIRNACAVAANLKVSELRPLLEDIFKNETNLVIKAQAKQSLDSF